MSTVPACSASRTMCNVPPRLLVARFPSQSASNATLRAEVRASGGPSGSRAPRGRCPFPAASAAAARGRSAPAPLACRAGRGSGSASRSGSRTPRRRNCRRGTAGRARCENPARRRLRGRGCRLRLRGQAQHLVFGAEALQLFRDRRFGQRHHAGRAAAGGRGRPRGGRRTPAPAAAWVRARRPGAGGEGAAGPSIIWITASATSAERRAGRTARACPRAAPMTKGVCRPTTS
jgi:hypothetical protein